MASCLRGGGTAASTAELGLEGTGGTGLVAGGTAAKATLTAVALAATEATLTLATETAGAGIRAGGHALQRPVRHTGRGAQVEVCGECTGIPPVAHTLLQATYSWRMLTVIKIASATTECQFNHSSCKEITKAAPVAFDFSMLLAAL